MQTIEIRLIDGQYTFITNGRASSTTFDSRFRIMMINKAKFMIKNTSGSFRLIMEDANGEVILDKEYADSSKVNMSEII
ncbi:hypothetical protein [Mycoplasma todarodis]|uniref:Uncharacterized protein n=1 Tax=Mycoplasma todarodis TaxID=1937191 RepID=A0A4R0XLF5_9MOLU|nr:hypothetical protein [Mycoplasma todarodis]TCG11304.1 hypothetical protein C4B25_01820 [Mycoplasma todarodis]